MCDLLMWSEHTIIDESILPKGRWRSSLLHTSSRITLRESRDILDFSAWLSEHGWSHDEHLTRPYGYTRRGDSLVCSLFGGDDGSSELMISWFDDTIEEIRLSRG